jgi:hypothetical protein
MITNMIAIKIKQIKYYAFKNYFAPYIADKLPLKSFLQALVKDFIVV